MYVARVLAHHPEGLTAHEASLENQRPADGVSVSAIIPMGSQSGLGTSTLYGYAGYRKVQLHRLP